MRIPTLAVFLSLSLAVACSPSREEMGALSHSPSPPEADRTLTIRYVPEAGTSRLTGSESVKLRFTLLGEEKALYSGSLPMDRRGEAWEISLEPAELMPSALLMVCAFIDGDDPEVYDNSDGKPWRILFHEDARPLRAARFQEYRLLTYRIRLTDLLAAPRDKAAARRALEAELDAHPEYFEARRELWTIELKEAAKNSVRLDSLRGGVRELLDARLAGRAESEEPGAEFVSILKLYGEIGEQARRDSLAAALLSAFPSGKFAEEWLYRLAMDEPDERRSVEIIQDFLERFPDSERAGFARGLSLYWYQVKGIDPARAKTIFESGEMIDPALLGYYAKSLKMAGELEFAEAVMRRRLADREKQVWSPEGSDSHDEWRRQQSDYLAADRHSLADILIEQSRDEEALALLERAAVEIPAAAGPGLLRDLIAVQLRLGLTEDVLGSYEGLARRVDLSEEERARWREIFPGDDVVFTARLTAIRDEARREDFTRLSRQALRRHLPEISITDHEGKELGLADFRGKVVLLDFWSTWCGPCMRALPVLDLINRDFVSNGDFVLIPLNTWEREEGRQRREAVAAAWEELGLEMRYYFDKDHSVAATRAVDSFGVTAIPSTFLIGPDGKLLFRMTGMGGEGDEANLRRKIEYALSLVE